MNRWAQSISLISIFWSICFASDFSSPPRHAEILRKIVLNIVSTATVDDMHLATSTVLLRTDSTRFPGQGVHQSVYQALLRDGNKIFTAPAQCDTVLFYAVTSATLRYGEPFSLSLFSSRIVERTVSLEMEFTLSNDASGQILFSKRYSQSITDTVYFSDVDRLNEPVNSFTDVQPSSPTLFDSLIEPAIITVASVVAIYLFFTIRS